MKTLNVTFTDAEYRKLKKAKREELGTNYNWRVFILRKCTRGVSEKMNLKK